MAGDATRGRGWGGHEVDFFISYARADEPWAEWIGWQLEAAGYRVRLQAWDFTAGAHFVEEMNQAVSAAARTVVVLSAAYPASRFAAAEWQVAWAADPSGEQRKILLIRVEDCLWPGLLGQIVSVDLFHLDVDAARERLLAAARGERGKPPVEPGFPGKGPPGQPAFPHGASGGTSGVPAALLDTEPLEAWLGRMQSAAPPTRLAVIEALRQAIGEGKPTTGETITALCAFIRAATGASRSQRLPEPQPDVRAATAVVAYHGLSQFQRWTNLSGAWLRGVTLAQATLVEADLAEANFEEANLSGANLHRAKLGGAFLSEANLSGARLSEANLASTNLVRANLRRAVLRKAYLSHADLTEADLTEADLSEADLIGASMSKIILDKAKLPGASLIGAYMSEARMVGADLTRADLGGSSAYHADLRGADLRGARLNGTRLGGADMNGADLQGADLSFAWLHEADLRNADLRGAKVVGTTLSGAKLAGVRVSRSQLKQAYR